jgi:hypothetical protein
LSIRVLFAARCRSGSAVEEVVGDRVMVGVEARRCIVEGHAESNGVLDAVGNVPAAVAARLEPIPVAGRRPRSGLGQVAVAPGPGVLDGHRRKGIDQVEPVIGVPPGAVAPEDVAWVAGRDVGAEAVGVLPGPVRAVRVVVVVGVGVEDKVAAAVLDEQAGPMLLCRLSCSKMLLLPVIQIPQDSWFRLLFCGTPVTSSPLRWI